MDELTKVREFRAGAPDPDSARLADGRRRLLGAAAGAQGRGYMTWTGRLRRRRRLLVPVLPVVAVLAVAAVLLGSRMIGGGVSTEVPPSAAPRELPGTASQVLERIADDLVYLPDPAGSEPRPGQWVYLRTYNKEYGGWEESWYPYADRRLEDPADKDDARSYRETYDFAVSLPADPQRLLTRAREFYEVKGEQPLPRAQEDYRVLELMLTGYPLPSSSLSKIYRAMATVPGIRVEGHTIEDVLGRQAIAVSQPDDDDRGREELLIDPETYAYIGRRGLMTEDLPEQGLKAGDTYANIARVEAAAVDHKGDRP